LSTADYVTPDIKLAVALAPKLQLKAISNVSLSAKIVSPEKPSLLSYVLGKVVAAWHIEGKEIRAVLPFGLTVLTQSPETEGPSIKIAEIGVGMRLSYRFKAPPTMEDLECIAHFVGVTGYMHAWPYFRADVQYLTSKLGFSALVLPVVVSGEVPGRVSVMSQAFSASANVSHKKSLPIAALTDQASPTPKRQKSKRTN
jgi:hypothetical protein